MFSYFPKNLNFLQQINGFLTSSKPQMNILI